MGIAPGRDQIGKLADVGAMTKSIVDHYSHFNWIFSGSDNGSCAKALATASIVMARGAGRKGRQSVVRRVRDPGLANSAMLHLTRSGLRRQRHRAIPIMARRVEQRLGSDRQ